MRLTPKPAQNQAFEDTATNIAASTWPSASHTARQRVSDPGFARLSATEDAVEHSVSRSIRAATHVDRVACLRKTPPVVKRVVSKFPEYFDWPPRPLLQPRKVDDVVKRRVRQFSTRHMIS